jgi:hypothetical protein
MGGYTKWPCLEGVPRKKKGFEYGIASLLHARYICFILSSAFYLCRVDLEFDVLIMH